MKEKILQRFLNYIKTNTQSDENSKTIPSTTNQLNFAKLLADELKQIGINDISIDNNGYLMGTLPANTDNKNIPVIGFIAHIDTSPDMPGTNINPQIINNYKGNDIILNAEKKIILSTSEFPELKNYIGQTLITTDGTTLLGADDKAGITAIVTAMEYLMEHPEIPHGTIRIGFTPDEEIGRGVDFFDVKKFNASFAYTIDGGAIGELEYENFNAASAKIFIQGKNIHPGYAKNKMINALLVAMELNGLLPVNQRPEYTSGYEGFFHLIKVDGGVEKCTMQYIIRDFDKTSFEKRKQLFKDIVDFINKKYDEGTAKLELTDQYFNMKEKVESAWHVIDFASKAMELCNVKPVIVPIRGGTDGARLSYMGLPCPNIFTGGHNFHGKYEFVPLESILKSTDVIITIAKLVAQK